MPFHTITYFLSFILRSPSFVLRSDLLRTDACVSRKHLITSWRMGETSVYSEDGGIRRGCENKARVSRGSAGFTKYHGEWINTLLSVLLFRMRIVAHSVPSDTQFSYPYMSLLSSNSVGVPALCIYTYISPAQHHYPLYTFSTTSTQFSMHTHAHIAVIMQISKAQPPPPPSPLSYSQNIMNVYHQNHCNEGYVISRRCCHCIHYPLYLLQVGYDCELEGK